MHLEWRLGAGTVLRNGKVAVAACAIALLSAGIAQAAIVFGPGDQQSPAGQTVEWTFSVSDDSATALLQSGSFTIPDVTETGPFQPVLKGTTNSVDCTMADRLKDGFTSQTKWLGSPFNRVAVTWAYIPDGTPVTITSGELMTCKFTISGEASGNIDLGCTNEDASDPDGNPLEGVTCQAGALEIGEPPATETPTATPTATPTVTQTPEKQSFAGCSYEGEFSITSPAPSQVIVEIACGADGKLTGTEEIVAFGVTLTCNGGCNTETGVLSGVECKGAATTQISGTLPAAGTTGPLTFTASGASNQYDVTNTKCIAPPTPTLTATGAPPTWTPTPKQFTGTLISESGCQMTAGNTTATPWALIIPAAALLVLRRRRG